MDRNLSDPGLLTREERSRIWFFIPFILAAAIAGIIWVLLPDESSKILQRENTDQELNISIQKRDLNLLFPDSGQGWISEIRTIPGGGSEREELRQCLLELIAGPEKGGIPLFPSAVELDDVFIDGKGIAYIDLHFDGSYLNLGGVLAEMQTIDALVKSLTANFPSIFAIQILVNGRVSETLAGHIDVSKPFTLPIEPEVENEKR
jgi:Sporulation and spore germination